MNSWMKGFVLAGILIAVVASYAAEPVELKPSEDGVYRAEIILDSYSYTPDQIIVPAGSRVELTLKNVKWIVPHSFVIKAPEAGMDIDQDVPAGETVTVQLTPTREGEFAFLCDKRLLFFASHDKKGMVGKLIVRPSS